MTLEAPISEKDLQEIKKSVLKKRGFDLSYFKSTFLARRINVRMKMLNISNTFEYANFLNSDPDEVSSLYNSLSINVTNFYRDKQVWKTFSNKVIPTLLNMTQQNDTIRIWSCGCASGEEPYSLAIMFSESLKNTKLNFKISATDINSHAIRDARNGNYTLENLKNLDEILITKYFIKIDSNHYQVKKEIKDLVSFNVGDIITFPVSYIDVIFCRNLLIYYGKNSQDLIFKKCLNVLKPNRFLVLGMDESLWGHKLQNSFIPLSSKERIYQRKAATDSLSEIITGN